jgi:thiamine biosynthesis lipoprotein ApbE
VEVLNLWGAATRSGGRLPRKDELVNQLKDAGFKQVETMRMFPGESFYAFKAMPGGKV